MLDHLFQELTYQGCQLICKSCQLDYQYCQLTYQHCRRAYPCCVADVTYYFSAAKCRLGSSSWLILTRGFWLRSPSGSARWRDCAQRLWIVMVANITLRLIIQTHHGSYIIMIDRMYLKSDMHEGTGCPGGQRPPGGRALAGGVGGFSSPPWTLHWPILVPNFTNH